MMDYGSLSEFGSIDFMDFLENNIHFIQFYITYAFKV